MAPPLAHVAAVMTFADTLYSSVIPGEASGGVVKKSAWSRS